MSARRGRLLLTLPVILHALPALAFEPVEDEDAFVDRVVERRLQYERGGTVIFRADGTFGGAFAGSAVTGEWVWEEDRVCHKLSVGAKDYPRDCRMPQIEGRRIRFMREDGTTFGVATIR